MNKLVNKRVAIVYDRVNKWGGAERVLLALHKLFPDAPLYTSLYNKQKAGWAKVFKIKTSFLQYLPFASSHHELLPLLMPLAFESFSFDNFDLVISVTSEAAKGIITKPSIRHICICLTPTRYLWSGYNEYFKNNLFKLISTPAVSYLRKWDMQASKRPDVYIAISEEVKSRIKKYYGYDAEVIYPPSGLMQEEPRFANNLKQNNYFLVVSRLVAYKRIDLAIRACNELGLQLKIIGKGNEENKLKKIAGDGIEFIGNVNDDELENYYKRCKALIYPGKEDFGLSMVEAQSYGKPVIAFKAGGALEIVKDGKTGLLYDKQNVADLKAALIKFEKSKFAEIECRKQADMFSFKTFKLKFIKKVEELFEN